MKSVFVKRSLPFYYDTFCIFKNWTL